MRVLWIVSIFLFLSSCSTFQKSSRPSDSASGDKIIDIEAVLNKAEEDASPGGKSILRAGRTMVSKNKIIRGSCWDYVNAVYNKAGFSPNHRITPLKNKIQGPYADSESLQPGDWLYFINHSFKEIDHSGIFIGWTNIDQKFGVLLSYVGGKKKKPGTYKIYDLSHVYYMIRPREL